MTVAPHGDRPGTPEPHPEARPVVTPSRMCPLHENRCDGQVTEPRPIHRVANSRQVSVCSGKAASPPATGNGISTGPEALKSQNAGQCQRKAHFGRPGSRSELQHVVQPIASTERCSGRRASTVAPAIQRCGVELPSMRLCCPGVRHSAGDRNSGIPRQTFPAPSLDRAT